MKEHARIVAVHTTKQVPAHLAEIDDFCMSITDEFLERTDKWTVPDQMLELGVTPDSEVYTALVNKLVAKKNVWRAGKGRKFDKGAGKGGGKGKFNPGGGTYEVDIHKTPQEMVDHMRVLIHPSPETLHIVLGHWTAASVLGPSQNMGHRRVTSHKVVAHQRLPLFSTLLPVELIVLGLPKLRLEDSGLHS